MPSTNSSTPARPIGEEPKSPTISRSRRIVTVLRMGLAFFFPWPFMTTRLQSSVTAEARRKHSPSKTAGSWSGRRDR